MEQSRKIQKCGFCGTDIDLTSPPDRKYYEAGRIHLQYLSTVLIPQAIVTGRHKPGHADAHAAELGGYYCSKACLFGRLEKILTLETKEEG